MLLKPPQLIIPALHCQSLFCLSNGSVSKRSKERSLQGRGDGIPVMLIDQAERPQGK